MKKQILNRVSFFVVILLLFSCRKDLETPTQVSTPRSEKPTGQFYNQASTIDVTILLSLEQDTLFNEYVYFLDYTYLLHLTDSLRKTTSNEKEFNTEYQAIMEERSGTLKERFVKTKEHYPKDFFKYVTYESKLKRDNRKTKNVDIDDVIVDGSEEVYSKMANCYNSIYGAFLSLTNRSYVLYSSKINKCHYKWCLSHERLVKSTMEGLALGINSLSNTQGLSYNFTRRITSADVRMAIENGYIDRMTVNELREESEFCIRLIDSVLAWNSNFELTFVISMNCYESHDSGGTPSGGGSGGTTKPDPDENCNDAKCPDCGKCINASKPNCTKCICCEHKLRCTSIGCGKLIMPNTRATTNCSHPKEDICPSSGPVCECGERHINPDTGIPICLEKQNLILYENEIEGYSKMWQISTDSIKEVAGILLTDNSVMVKYDHRNTENSSWPVSCYIHPSKPNEYYIYKIVTKQEKLI